MNYNKRDDADATINWQLPLRIFALLLVFISFLFCSLQINAACHILQHQSKDKQQVNCVGKIENQM